MEIEIFAKRGIIDRREVRNYVKKILAAEKKDAKGLNLILTDNAYVKALNRKFLRRNRSTDVIAFNGDSDFLGEIYISFEMAQAQARKFKVSLEEELYRLVTHGLLHLIGYEHPRITEVQDYYLKRFLCP